MGSLAEDRLAYRDAIGGLTRALGGARRRQSSTAPAEPEVRTEPTRRTERPTGGSSARGTEVDRRVEELKEAHRRYVAREGDDGEPADPVDQRVQELEEARRSVTRRGS